MKLWVSKLRQDRINKGLIGVKSTSDQVARENGLPVQQVQQIVNEHVRGRALGLLGDLAVNVLELTLAVEAARR